LTVPIVSTARNDKERRKMRKLKKDGKLPETLKKEPRRGDAKVEEQDQAMTQGTFRSDGDVGPGRW
jgi:hypothetical protein